MTQQIDPPTPPYGPPAEPEGAAAPAPPTRVAAIPPPGPYGRPPVPPPAAPFVPPQAGPPAAPVPPPQAAPAQAAPAQAAPAPGSYAPPQPGPFPQPSYGPPPSYGPQPSYSPPQPYGQPAGPPPGGFGYPAGGPPKKKHTGLIVGIVVGVLVLAGLGVGAIFLFGTKYLDTAKAQSEIARITQQQVGETPSGVTCPSDIKLETGKTFQCTAALEGQPVTYTVKETDDQGNVDIKLDNNLIVASKVEDSVAQQVGQQIGIDVTASCDTGGKHVLVDQQDKPITCTVTNKNDSGDSAQVTATVDDQGNVTVHYPNQ